MYCSEDVFMTQWVPTAYFQELQDLRSMEEEEGQRLHLRMHFECAWPQAACSRVSRSAHIKTRQESDDLRSVAAGFSRDKRPTPQQDG